MVRVSRIRFAALIVALVWACAAPALAQNAPDVVLYNGKISTVDANNTTVDALAIRDGKILATGTTARMRALAGPATRQIDLKQRRVLPGLVDAHLHGLRTAYQCWLHSVQPTLISKRSAALALYKKRAAQVPPGDWMFSTTGWTSLQFDVPGMYTKAELDAAVPDHPLLVTESGNNAGQVNSVALKVLGMDPSSSGKLTGPELRKAYLAVGAELAKQTIDQQADCLAGFIREMNHLGLTAWHDGAGEDDFFKDTDGRRLESLRGSQDRQAVIQLYRDGRLNMRLDTQIISFRGMQNVRRDTVHAISGIGDDMLRIGGIGEEVDTAGPDGLYPMPEYQQIVNYLAQNRWSLEHHSNRGAAQLEQVGAWEQANKIYPIKNLRWFMTHPGEGPTYPTPDILQRLKALGAGVVPTASGVNGRGGAYPPFKRIYESGIHACAASDALWAGPYAPFVTMWYMVSGNTFNPKAPGVGADQRLTREQALRMETANCGWFVYQEGKIGSLEPGKYADLIALSDDYFSVPVSEIKDLTSVLTMVGGRIVFADAEFAQFDPRR